VRTLATSQRLPEAAAEISSPQNEPNLAPPWLTLGALGLNASAQRSDRGVLNPVRLVERGAAVQFGTAASAPPAGDDEDDTPPNASTALTQAFLLLAQAAEQQRDYAGAERWLARVDNPQRALEVQARRASLLARQGKIKEARELIRKVPEHSPSDARAKLLAETELLRERKMYVEAEQVMAQANKTFPDDTDLLYEQAMLNEKLDRMDEMERLLRRVIAIKSDHQHAYNALGYSLADRNIRLPEARTVIQKALELSPGEPAITDSMGWGEYRLGNHEEAIRCCATHTRRAETGDRGPSARVLWSAGRSEEGRRVFRDARSRDAQNDVLRETLALAARGPVTRTRGAGAAAPPCARGHAWCARLSPSPARWSSARARPCRPPSFGRRQFQSGRLALRVEAVRQRSVAPSRRRVRPARRRARHARPGTPLGSTRSPRRAGHWRRSSPRHAAGERVASPTSTR
jgi:tetratricopeptide (TPR) repeat protein